MNVVKTNVDNNHFSKKIFLYLITSLIVATGFSQKTPGDIYLYKKDGSPAEIKDAAFLMHVFPLNDTTYISRYYNFSGSMMRQESYKDSALTIPNGRFCWYNTKGELDSTGTVTNGKKDGNWLYIISKTVTRSVDYENGKRGKEQIFHYDEKGKYINTDSAGNNEPEDTTEKAAEYKRGVKDWVLYCQENLQTPQRLQDVLRDGVHTCIVSFLVDKKGYTKDIYLIKSCEWSGDAEVLRLIADSPPWKPATKQGEPVIYRQKQSLSFNVISR